jgi:hypothetical protein
MRPLKMFQRRNFISLKASLCILFPEGVTRRSGDVDLSPQIILELQTILKGTIHIFKHRYCFQVSVFSRASSCLLPQPGVVFLALCNYLLFFVVLLHRYVRQEVKATGHKSGQPIASK